ncbi:MAG: flagellar hook-basal body complex protein, partial [Acidobacteriaceae bacterium]
TGYKSQTTAFEDLFYQQVGSSGSGNPVQGGQGVKVSANSTDFTSGSLVPTGTSSNVALSGGGFFVVDNGGAQEYTRAGNFNTDQNGNLVTTDGMSVLGYPATNGVVNTNAPLAALQIPPVGQTDSPRQSSQLSFGANLDSDAPIGTTVPAQITLYDSLGQGHLATVALTKTATANTWDYAISLPATEYTGAAANTTGTLAFNGSGQLITPAPAAPPAAPNSGLPATSFGGLTDGAGAMNFTWNLFDQSGNPTLTQVASASNVSGTNQDGYASGTSIGFSVNPSGVISVQYSNGQTQSIGQLAVATVNNQQGLKRVGGNNYAATLATGEPAIGVGGTGGRGSIEGGELEGSNVNIASQFSNLIVAQNAYEANAKSVSTFDTVLQATINMIR